MQIKITVLPGDGIGPEVTSEAVRVLEVIVKKFAHELEYTTEKIGGVAINEFNDNHQDIKLGLPYYLLARQIVESWYHKIRICHFFNHHRYNDFISADDQQLACR